MSNLNTKVILTMYLFFVFNLISNAQCMITKTEYESIIDNLEYKDPIVGLYFLQGQTLLYENDSLIRRQFDDNLDWWYIIPSEDSYTVCHTDYTVSQEFTATFYGVAPDAYDYEVEYHHTGEKARAQTVLRYADQKDTDSEKIMIYEFMVPPKKATLMGAREGQKVKWVFLWTNMTLDQLYYEDSLQQEAFYTTMYEQYNAKEWTDDEITNLLETADNDFSKEIRKQLDLGTIHNYPGSYLLPDNISEDRFLIVSVNTLFYDRVSYFIMFEKFNEKIIRVDFKIDKDGGLVKMLSLNPSYYHNKKLIQFLSENNQMFDDELWR